MIEYAMKYGDKLLAMLAQHVQIVLITLVLSLVLAWGLTLLAMLVPAVGRLLQSLFSALYSVPSLALFAIMMPVTGLGMTTAVIVLVLYNQYLLLRNFITGLNEVDPAAVEASIGMGMTPMQVLYKVRLPLSKKALFVGIRLAVVSTIGIATIAACINAGGLGTILFDGLRTMNTVKILWGSLLSAGLAVAANSLLIFAEKRLT